MPAPLRIALADDHALFRAGLRSLLELDDGVRVVAEVERVDDLVPLVEGTPCDVLLLDLQMDRNALVEIATVARRVAVVVVTASERADEAMAALRAGARGVVFKRFAIETLRDALRAVTEGHVWVPPVLQAELAAALRAPRPEPLTPREREIVRYVALGLRNAEVGRSLFISEDTVKTHLNNVFKKLGLRDRAELTRYAIRVGIVGVHDEPT
jgi:DNA-binding NarL/FixJ family response regulator